MTASGNIALVKNEPDHILLPKKLVILPKNVSNTVSLGWDSGVGSGVGVGVGVGVGTGVGTGVAVTVAPVVATGVAVAFGVATGVGVGLTYPLVTTASVAAVQLVLLGLVANLQEPL